MQEACEAVDAVLAAFEKSKPEVRQISNLSAAVSALGTRSFELAIDLAHSAAKAEPARIRTHRHSLPQVKKALSRIRRIGSLYKEPYQSVLATPIVNDRFEIVGWTKASPNVEEGVLRLDEVEERLGSSIISKQVSIIDQADQRQAGAPAAWKGVWRCFALCSANISHYATGTALVVSSIPNTTSEVEPVLLARSSPKPWPPAPRPNGFDGRPVQTPGTRFTEAERPNRESKEFMSTLSAGNEPDSRNLNDTRSVLAR